jgi:hypothetical protein
VVKLCCFTKIWWKKEEINVEKPNVADGRDGYRYIVQNPREMEKGSVGKFKVRSTR